MTFDDLQEKFAVLSTREKLMVISALFLAVWGIWDEFFYQSFKKQQTEFQQQLSSVKQQIATQQQITIQLEAQVKIDPNLNNRHKLQTLKTKYQQLQAKLQKLDEKFIPPKLMAKVLTDILKQTQNTPLIKLKTLPVSTLLDFETQQTVIYKHELVMTFSGNYRNTLNYLKILESLPWHFVIESIDYKVKDYPLAEITLHAYTLSFKKAWLNV